MKSRNVGAMSAQKIIKLLADRGVLVVLGTSRMAADWRPSVVFGQSNWSYGCAARCFSCVI